MYRSVSTRDVNVPSCRKPNYAAALFWLRDQMEAVTVFGDRLAGQGKRPDSTQVLNTAKLADSRWLNQEELGKLCLETLTETEYKEFLAAAERLVALPYSYRVKEDLWRYRTAEAEAGAIAGQDFIQPQFDTQGRAVVEAEGRRKTSKAAVRVVKPGTGLVEIRNSVRPDLTYDITYFYALKDRHQIMFPLQFSKLLGLVDLSIEVEGGGPSGQAGAIRFATALALRSFVTAEVVADMKLVGLLTQDIRVRERKKPGKVSARKSYTWKRR